jgi:drug/metabolite transporter (DMT)-like permease
MFLVALLAMYHGFQKTEVSHSGPLVGVSTTLFVVFLSRLFLNEVLTLWQMIGIAIIVIGCILISFQKTKKTSGFSRALFWALLSGLLFALSHVSAKYIYTQYDFWTGTVWTKGVMGMYGLALLLLPSVRQEIFKKTTKKIPHSKVSLLPIIANRTFSIVGTGLTQYATALGSVSIVNALQGVQYAVLIILVLFLTRYHPKIFKEFYTRGEIIIEILAVVIVAFGLILLVVK